MGLRKNTMQATPSDLDTLRSDSKMRLQQGLPYRLNNDSTNSNTRSKDMGYYAGEKNVRARSALRSDSTSNLRVD